MQAFIIESSNRPGEFARQAAAIASEDVNVAAISMGIGMHGASAFLTRKESALRRALKETGITYSEVPVLTVSLEDRPGTEARAAKKLADAGVNIELFVPLEHADGKAIVAIGVDKIEEARRALSDQLTEWMVPEPEPMHAGIGVAS